MKILKTPHMDRCIGCHSCSLACARLVNKRFSWESAGIRIESSGGLSSGFVAKRCLACHPAPCAAVCPSGCLRERPGGGVTIRRNLCIRCGECVAVCPVDGIAVDEFGDISICLHCGSCVEFCPHDCLEMGVAEAGNLEEEL